MRGCCALCRQLHSRKGLPFLIESAKIIVNENKQTKFIIVGEEAVKKPNAPKLETTNLASNFTFMGNVKEDMLPLIYNCADVFALPSIQEGQGIVLLEAQASAEALF